MSERNVALFIADILESIDAIEDFVKGCDYESFFTERKIYSATLREFIVIGEAISNIPDEMKNLFPDISWRIIKDFRNFIVHEYFGIDNGIVWNDPALAIDWKITVEPSLSYKDANSVLLEQAELFQ